MAVVNVNSYQYLLAYTYIMDDHQTAKITVKKLMFHHLIPIIQRVISPTHWQKLLRTDTHVMDRRDEVLESVSGSQGCSGTPLRVCHHLAEGKVLEAVHAPLDRLAPGLLVSYNSTDSLQNTILYIVFNFGDRYIKGCYSK